MPGILNRTGPLKAVHPEDGDKIENRRAYVAPPNFHLLVENGRVRLGRGPRENRHRPAVDPLFRSAALAYGPRVVGVVLTGARDDGTAGLLAINRRGGVAIVQDANDALFSGMPERALRCAKVDHCVPLDKIPPLLDRVVREEAKEEGAYPVPDEMELESKLAGLDPTTIETAERPGELSAFTCPDCSGPLYEIQDGKLIRFRCRVGHAHTASSMLDEKTDALDRREDGCSGECAVRRAELPGGGRDHGAEAGRASALAGPGARGQALRGAGARGEAAGRGDPAGAPGRHLGPACGRGLVFSLSAFLAELRSSQRSRRYRALTRRGRWWEPPAMRCLPGR